MQEILAAVIVGTLGIVQAVIGPLVQHRFPSKSSKGLVKAKTPLSTRLTFFIVGVVSAAIGIGLGIVISNDSASRSSTSQAAAPDASQPSVEITSHHNGDRVPPQTIIDGKVKGVQIKGVSPAKQGEMYELWVMVIPQADTRYYPQKGPVSVQPDGDWRSVPVFARRWFNSKTDIRKRYGVDFDVIAVLADENAQLELYRYTTSGVYKGLDALPKGAVEYYRVSLIRP